MNDLQAKNFTIFLSIHVFLICKYACQILLSVLIKTVYIITWLEFSLNYCICLFKSKLYHLTGLKKITKTVIFVLSCGCLFEF